jgi:pyruvate dehydrogenase E2 component (dihydrolipoamide acetyltransferase)
VNASPYARKLAAEAGVSLAGAAGSGPGGRITAEDVQQLIASGGAAPASAAAGAGAVAAAGAGAVAAAGAGAVAAAPAGGYTDVQVRMRCMKASFVLIDVQGYRGAYKG